MTKLSHLVLSLGTTAVAALALVLLVVNIFLVTGNQARQAEITLRAQIIERARQSSPLVQDLVIAARKEPNEKIRALLTKYKIPFTQPAPSTSTPSVNPGAGGAPAPTATPPTAPAKP